MKIKSQLTLATLIVAGVFATGCQQMSQQTAQQTAEPIQEAPAVTTTTTADPNAHTHPAVPGCTNSITHSHPSNNPNHTHRYSCKGMAPQMPRVPQVKAKGNYKGPVQMDRSSQQMMRQYQQ